MSEVRGTGRRDHFLINALYHLESAHQYQGFYGDPNDTATEEPTEAIESIAQAQKVGE